ncbi:cardiolipin synthase [Candidatus Saccharibacteria bacterium]|nr:cardiolipin synthase [Candidatus Saccharibacteria bacterium]HOR23578.1 cardiolipin synthase [Candidatus Saccharibacteria bacterium]HPW48002.1 cardiolipin synthase [Candidatus Saccharibacteria bacterium]
MHVAFSQLFTLIYIMEWGIRVVMVFVVPRNRKPSSATAWLVLIMVMPTLGLLVFWLLGSPKLNKKRRHIQNQMNNRLKNVFKNLSKDTSFSKYFVSKVPIEIKPVVDLNSKLGTMPLLSNNQIELFSDYYQTFSQIAKDIDKSKNHVHFEFFIINLSDETKVLFEAIERAVNRGVKVRVLLDAIGSRKYPGYRSTLKKLNALGVEWRKMLPLDRMGPGFNRPDLRNHRKIIIIDGITSYVGSQNLVKRDYHRKDEIVYDELMVKVTGPVAVELNSIFASDWYAETGVLLIDEIKPGRLHKFSSKGSLVQASPSGPAYRDDNNLKMFTSLIHQARHKIVITNPYFVPDDSLMTAITSAAQRGVQISMINSEVMDQKLVGHAQRSYYEQLLKAGVKIYWYKKPTLLHSKSISIDDGVAVVGSSNLDIRSFQLNFEVCLLIYDSSFVKKLRKLENQYLNNSRQVTLKYWQSRSIRSTLLDNLARLTAVLQ